MENVREEILKLSSRKKKITWKEYQKMSMNSFERDIIRKNMDNDALCRETIWCISNCGKSFYSVPSTYDEAVIYTLAPELIKRLRKKGNGK
jgi:hypothetical protein